jgi:serine/threonine protein kinase
MLCGYEPFYGETDAELIQANKEAKLEFPDSDWKSSKYTFRTNARFIYDELIHVLVSSPARNLVQAMLERDPNKRISAQQALMHPWITSHYAPCKLPSNKEWNGVVTGAACTIC